MRKPFETGSDRRIPDRAARNDNRDRAVGGETAADGCRARDRGRGAINSAGAASRIEGANKYRRGRGAAIEGCRCAHLNPETLGGAAINDELNGPARAIGRHSADEILHLEGEDQFVGRAESDRLGQRELTQSQPAFEVTPTGVTMSPA